MINLNFFIKSIMSNSIFFTHFKNQMTNMSRHIFGRGKQTEILADSYQQPFIRHDLFNSEASLRHSLKHAGDELFGVL